jgi:O-antigen/teichoic acid export membrane protein
MTAALARPAEQTSPGGTGGSMGRVARSSSANLAGAGVMAFASFGLAIVVARGLDKEAAGVFFSVTSLFLLANAVGALGTGTGLVYFLSRCRALGTHDLVRVYLRSAAWPVLATAVLLAATMLVLAPQVASVTNPDQVDQATSYLRVLAIFIPFAAMENIALAATRGMGTMRPNATVEQFGRPLTQLLLVTAVVALPATGLLGWAWACAYAPAAVAAWIWWRRLHSRLHVAGPESAEGRAREFWRFTGPRSLASIAQLAMQRFDIVLVGALAGATEAAIYAVGTRFIVAGQMGRNAISLAIQPPLAKALSRNEHASAKHLCQISTAWLMAIVWPMFLVFVVFGDTLLGVFGGGYDDGLLVLQLLSLAMLLASLCGDVDSVLLMAGKTSWSLANTLLALGVQIGLDLWLIPGHGAAGAAIGWAAGIATKNLVALAQVALALRLHPFGRASTVTGALAILCFVLVPFVVRSVGGEGWASMLTGLALGTACYALGVWRFRGTLELQALRSLRRRRPKAHA